MAFVSLKCSFKWIMTTELVMIYGELLELGVI
jgi:hypothetical protein